MQNDKILEAVGDDDWRPTARDIRMLNQGRKPAWAKKVTEIGPRKAKPRTSTSPSELAMRRVTEPDYRKPFSETDLKNAREGEELMNARIAHRIQKAFDDFTVSMSADEISVNTPTVRFKVIPYGPVYKVKTIYSATRSEMEDCESLYQVIELIKKNSQNIGESMNVDAAMRYMRGDAELKEALLDEALETLKNIGATITEDTDDWDDADLPAGMTDTQRKKWAHRHNQTMSRDFEKFWKRSNHGKDYHDAKDDYKRHYGVEPVDDDKTLWGEEGRNLQQKVTRAKSFAGTPENNPAIGEIFDLMKKSGWKYIGEKMGSNKEFADFAIEKFFYFKKPGKGKKDFIVSWAYAYDDEGDKPSKTLDVSYHINGRDGAGSFKNAAAFVKEVNWEYAYYMGNKRSYNRHDDDDEPDYEEMAALAYEDR